MVGWFIALSAANAAPVVWVDWESGTAGASGVAAGTLHTPTGDITVDYSGELFFVQTDGGTNYYVPSAPYTSATVDNAPPDSDILALSTASSKTLLFSEPIDDLFFAVVSLNGNGYEFDADFEIVSFGAGYWGDGTLSRVDNGDGTFSVVGTGEPHGVIRFTGAVSSITWTSLSNEAWNGFTIGTYGAADLDEDNDGVEDGADLCLGEDATGFDSDADGCLDDTDGDGLTDDVDLCPQDDASGFDLDGDGCVDDSDGDGVLDPLDVCPTEDATGADLDGDGCIDTVVDADGDGVDDAVDNCLDLWNEPQTDSDADGVGNACELGLGVDVTGAVTTLTATGALPGERIRFFHTDLSAANLIKHAVLADASGTATITLRVPPGTPPGTAIVYRAAARRNGNGSISSAGALQLVP
jgi:hypothetical protein